MLPVRCEKLVKTYGEVQALNGLDLEVQPGEVYGLLGPNGAGKSTTTKILLTVVAPTSGKAEVLGVDVTQDPDAVRRQVGYVPQELTSDPNLTGRENLDFFARIYHLGKERKARIAELLAMVDLEEAADRLVKTYSGGMRKRLDIATGLLHKPQVVFLDEPSLGLDVPGRQRVWEEIRTLKSQGVTILLCTNSMEEADTLCDRLGIIHGGKLCVSGTPAELRGSLGGDVVRLQARGEDSAWTSFQTAAEALEPVVGFVREGDRARLTVKDGDQTLPGLLEAARDAELKLASLDFQRPSLEQVFLHYADVKLGESVELA